MGAPDQADGGLAPATDRCIVSAIMPAFNSAAFISRAVDSVLSQQGTHRLELIIVDDCSVDGTPDFIRGRYGADERVRLLSTDRNSGPGAARNLAISAATGDWIAPIDADDCWMPDRLARLLPLCGEDVDLVFDNLVAFDHAISRAGDPIFPAMPTTLTVPVMAAECAPGSTYNYGYLKPLVRKSFLDATGVRYPDVRISEDLLFYLELLIHRPKTRLTEEAGYVYTTSVGTVSRHRSSASTSVPDDLLVAGMLDDLVRRYAKSLTSADVEAIRRRSDALRDSAPLIRLYESWTRGQYLKFAWQCLSDPEARRALIGKLRGRRTPSAGPSA